MEYIYNLLKKKQINNPPSRSFTKIFFTIIIITTIGVGVFLGGQFIIIGVGIIGFLLIIWLLNKLGKKAEQAQAPKRWAKGFGSGVKRGWGATKYGVGKGIGVGKYAWKSKQRIISKRKAEEEAYKEKAQIEAQEETQRRQKEQEKQRIKAAKKARKEAEKIQEKAAEERHKRNIKIKRQEEEA